MSPLHYTTYFDRHYLTRGLALYHSLVQHSPPFTLWVLCLDATTEAVLRKLALPHVELLPLAELEDADAELAAVKRGRTALEYYWSCTASLLGFLFRTRPQIELLTYLDADLYFYADPTPIFSEFEHGSMLVVPTRYSAMAYRQGGRSRFNVGFNAFRRGCEALACLARWREQCLEWCFDRYEPTRFGDQKYLDDWPERYPGLVVLDHPGAGLSPTNVGARRLTIDADRVLVDGWSVIFFHFTQLRIVRPWLYEVNLKTRGTVPSPTLKHAIIVPYARAIRRAARQMEALSRDIPARDILPRRRAQLSLWRMLWTRSGTIVTDSFAL